MPVTRFERRLTRPLGDGRAFGDTGPYEELKGRLHFAIDPRHPANQRIADVERAPRDADGRVLFASDVSILLPVERGRASGRLLLDVVNRGNTVAVPNFNRATRPVFGPGSDPDPAIDVGDGFLMRRGYVVISVGWQGDLPALPGLFRLHGPSALDGAGRPLRGRVHSQLQPPARAAHLLLSDRGHLPYPAADLDEPDALLTVQDQADAPPTTIRRDRWRFARDAGGAVVPDPGSVRLEGGFEPGRLYRITYTAVGAPVVGLSLAALRDAVAWLKHGAEDDHPAPGAGRHAYAYGRSQTGRLLRTLGWEDLNVDEAGREALDGVLVNVAGGMRGEFNQRFGQNSKDRPHMIERLFPFTDTVQTDAGTGETDGLHRRLEARGSRLRAIYTNSSAEYHRGDASLIHTDPEGRRDVAPGLATRVYHFAGTEHGLGTWPPSAAVAAAADPSGWIERSQNLRGVLDYARLLRACLVNLDRWVTDGIAPPPSRHPRIENGTAVPPAELAKTFARIPGAHFPPHHPRLRPARPFGSLVSAVDGDGNEVGGLALPELAVPLGTHTGWNLRDPAIGGESQLLVFAGSTLPFARTRAEREAAGDPRPAIAERYASREDYLARVRRAAEELVEERYLLAEDVELSVALAARMWDRFTA